MAVSSVAAADPTTVLPAFVAREFVRSQRWPIDENVYRNGERQTRATTSTPMVSWQISAVVSVAVRDALWNFLAARKFIEPFYFYDGTETSPQWTHDPTGTASVGRYTVVAVSPLGFSQGMARALMNLKLEQRA